MRGFVPALCLMLLAACSAVPPVNVPLAGKDKNDEPHNFSTPDVAGRPVLLAAFSGGGSRATALGMSVLQELQRYSYPAGGGARSLIDDIRAVSSVSGGSVAAAYFVDQGPAGLADLRKRFLERDNMAELEWQAAFPITWLRLAFTQYTRVQALQDLLQRTLFGNDTFGGINRPGKPILLLNATDMASGQVFAFTPSRFDDICSDLGALPLAAAVAASADFPVALSPMTIRNYSRDCTVHPPVPGWVTYDLSQDALARYLDLEEYKAARYSAALRHLDAQGQPAADPAASPYRDIEYLHLLDGGVADNVGAHSLIPLFAKNYGAGFLFDAIQKGNVTELAILTVNARSDTPSPLDTDPAVPGVIASIASVTSVPIDNNTAAVNALVRETDFTLSEQRWFAPADAKIRLLRVYDITIDFDQLPDSEAALRERVKRIATSWTLSTSELDDIDRAAQILVQQHPCFQQLLIDLGIRRDFINARRAQFCVTRPPKI
jgi:NTE family protein